MRTMYIFGCYAQTRSLVFSFVAIATRLFPYLYISYEPAPKNGRARPTLGVVLMLNFGAARPKRAP